MTDKTQKSFYIPILKILKESGGTARKREIVRRIIEERGFSKAEIAKTTASGSQLIDNRIAWARQTLLAVGYISKESPWGMWQLTKEGQLVDLATLEPSQLDREAQEVFRLRNQQRATPKSTTLAASPDADPEPSEEQYREELLAILKELPPEQFEKICGRLLREIGFAEVKITQQSRDGGIDGSGLVEVNPLVKIPVLFQFKRYAGTVGASVVRDLRGAIQGRAEKGAIITTGSFTLDAEKEASREGVSTIDLIDGDALVDLFVKHELGVLQTYKVDESFFSQFRN